MANPKTNKNDSLSSGMSMMSEISDHESDYTEERINKKN